MAILNISKVLGAVDEDRLPPLEARALAMRNHLKSVLEVFPQNWGNEANLVLAGADPQGRGFRLFEFTVAQKAITQREVKFDNHRYLAWGSGAGKFRSLVGDQPDVNTDNILSAMQKVIDDHSIASVGGVLQMVTIMKSKSQPVAFVRKVDGRKEAFLGGVPLQYHSNLSQIRCLDEKLRVCPYPKNAEIKPAGIRRDRPTDVPDDLGPRSPNRSGRRVKMGDAYKALAEIRKAGK